MGNVEISMTYASSSNFVFLPHNTRVTQCPQISNSAHNGGGSQQEGFSTLSRMHIGNQRKGFTLQ